MPYDDESIDYPEPDPEVDQWAKRVIGAAIEVHRHLGPGHLESVYENAMCVEMRLRQIPFARQVAVGVDYKGEIVGDSRVDLIVAGCLVVELKAVDALINIHKAQIISYLRITRCKLGLLINFNTPVLKDGVKRVILS